MSLGQRIKQSREQHGYQQKDLAKKVGVRSAGVISNWERDLNKPDADKIVQLCKVLEISSADLLDCHIDEAFVCTSKEKTMIHQFRHLDSIGQEAILALLTIESQRQEKTILPTRTIPFFSARPSAGLGNWIFDNEAENIEIIDGPQAQKADYVLQVDGNSMEPKFHHGQYVLVHKQETIQPNEMGIFVINGEVWIKQFQKDHLHSINPEYTDIPFEEGQDIYCMGKVIGVAERV